MSSHVDPDFLAELDSEAEYARKGNRPDRLAIEKGCGAVVRFLPVRMGTRHTWFGRVGRHWYNKKYIGCPRATAVSMGGSLDAECPVCDLSETLMVDRDEVISKAGKSMSVWPKYLTYVLVLEWIDKRDDHEAAKPRDLYTPMALWLPRTAFTELERLIKKSLTTAPGLGLVDPVRGNDVEVRLDMRNNWRLDLLDSQPIRNDMDDEALVAWTDALCRDIKLEDTTPGSYEQLEEYAKQIEKQLSDVPPPQRRGRYEEGTDEVATPRRSAAPTRAPAPRAAAPAPAPVSDVEAELDAETDEAPPPPPPVRRAATPAPAPRAAAPAQARAPLTPPPARRPAAMTPPPARRAVAPAESSDDDEVAPETRDAAPPIADGDDEAPPPVPASAPRPAQPVRRVSAALRATLDRGI